MFAGIYFLRVHQPQGLEVLREGGEATGMRRRQGCIVRNKDWIVGNFVGYSEAAKKDSDMQSLLCDASLDKNPLWQISRESRLRRCVTRRVWPAFEVFLASFLDCELGSEPNSSSNIRMIRLARRNENKHCC